MPYVIECAACKRTFDAALATAKTCGDVCRARLYRGRLRVKRARLAADAEAAINSGDLAALEVVARRTAELLRAA